MASGLSFFSSPPHPTSDPWQHQPSTFYTPQHTSKHNRAIAFAPTSPSPLRTSRNVNLMSRPLHGGEIFKTAKSEDRNENSSATTRENAPNPLNSHTPFSFPANPSELSAPSSTTLDSTTTPSFNFTSTNPSDSPFHFSTAQDRATHFQFEARARSSSPSALLQSFTKDNRDSRKRLFLDRLRNKRDDARTDRTSDQVLRMDYIRERKQWEAEKERMTITEWEDSDVDAMVDTDPFVAEEEGDMSSTEDKEIEALANSYYLQQQDITEGGGDHIRNQSLEDFSDDGYDEAFMEVLSQEPASRGCGQGDNSTHGGGLGLSINQQRQHNNVPTDSEMDMS